MLKSSHSGPRIISPQNLMFSHLLRFREEVKLEILQLSLVYNGAEGSQLNVLTFSMLHKLYTEILSSLLLHLKNSLFPINSNASC